MRHAATALALVALTAWAAGCGSTRPAPAGPAPPPPAGAGAVTEARTEGAAAPGAADPATQWGLPLPPGAEARPELAAAIGAYYAPAREAAGLEVAVFETAAPFEEVYALYGPLMEAGKWGWRRKSLQLEHQTRTLGFLRRRAVEERGSNGRLPAELAPLLGDPALGPDEVAARLAALLESHGETTIELVEGVRPLPDEPHAGDLRVIVERPYVDLVGFELVDRTRIQILRLPG